MPIFRIAANTATFSRSHRIAVASSFLNASPCPAADGLQSGPEARVVGEFRMGAKLGVRFPFVEFMRAFLGGVEASGFADAYAFHDGFKTLDRFGGISVCVCPRAHPTPVQPQRNAPANVEG